MISLHWKEPKYLTKYNKFQILLHVYRLFEKAYMVTCGKSIKRNKVKLKENRKKFTIPVKILHVVPFFRLVYTIL